MGKIDSNRITLPNLMDNFRFVIIGGYRIQITRISANIETFFNVPSQFFLSSPFLSPFLSHLSFLASPFPFIPSQSHSLSLPFSFSFPPLHFVPFLFLASGFSLRFVYCFLYIIQFRRTCKKKAERFLCFIIVTERMINNTYSTAPH